MVVDGRVLRRAGTVAVVVLFATLLTSSSAYGAQPLGVLTQLSGTAGCFTHNGASEDGAGTCSTARGPADGESAVVSPDGANVVRRELPEQRRNAGRRACDLLPQRVFRRAHAAGGKACAA